MDQATFDTDQSISKLKLNPVVHVAKNKNMQLAPRTMEIYSEDIDETRLSANMGLFEDRNWMVQFAFMILGNPLDFYDAVLSAYKILLTGHMCSTVFFTLRSHYNFFKL